MRLLTYLLRVVPSFRLAIRVNLFSMSFFFSLKLLLEFKIFSL